VCALERYPLFIELSRLAHEPSRVILDDDIERAWLGIGVADERELDHWFVERTSTENTVDDLAGIFLHGIGERASLQRTGKPELALERTIALANPALRVDPEYREREK